MIYTTIAVAIERPAAVITLDRPQRRNAISKVMMDEIVDAARVAEADPAVSTVILTGGRDFFSAGADLTEAVEVKTTLEGLDYFGRLHRLNACMEELKKPVIAAIEGFCFTGGCELALACDLRIAGEGASFAITSSRIGTVAGAGGTQRLPRTVGASNALAMLFSAEPIDATEALRIGLINRKTPKGGALAAALVLAGTYAERAPLSLALTKRAVYCGLQMDLAAAIEFERHIAANIYTTADKQEGITAFLEKRKACFTGR